MRTCPVCSSDPNTCHKDGRCVHEDAGPPERRGATLLKLLSEIPGTGIEEVEPGVYRARSDPNNRWSATGAE